MKVINKIVAFILVFAIVITNTNIVLAKNVDVSNLHLESVNIREEEKILKDIYNGLGAEAKEIFLEEIKGDFELQKLHKKYVDKNYSLGLNKPKLRFKTVFYPKIELRSATVATGFAVLNLPGPVLYALKAVSAGFVAAAADGPLPFGDAVLLTASIALVGTLAIYWNSVAPKWPQIVRVFERQFSNSISTVRRVLAKVKGDTKSKVKEKEKKESERRVKDVLKGKSKERTTKGKTDIYNGKGGKAQADRDFNKLNKGKVEKKIKWYQSWSITGWYKD